MFALSLILGFQSSTCFKCCTSALTFHFLVASSAQTEGDTGYDYDAAYDDDEADNDESGQVQLCR